MPVRLLALLGLVLEPAVVMARQRIFFTGGQVVDVDVEENMIGRLLDRAALGLSPVTPRADANSSV